MTVTIEWHQTRLVLIFRWVLAFTLLGPPIGGFWAVATVIFAPFVYFAAPAAAIAGLLYIASSLALQKRKLNNLASKLIIASLSGALPVGVYLSMIGNLKIIILGIASGAVGAIGAAMFIEHSVKARRVFGLPEQSSQLYTIDPNFT